MPSPRFQLLLLVTTLMTVVSPVDAQMRARRQEVRADDGHPLTVWVKRPQGKARRAILLLHGRTWSSRPNFDLQVPGKHLSLMDALAARGYAVYALDQRGYGSTPRDSSGWLTPDRAVRDAALVLDRIAHDVRAGPPALLGYSRGAMTAMLLAQKHPDKTSALILYAFPIDPWGRPGQAPPAPDATQASTSPPRKRTTVQGAAEDFITPERTPAGVKEEYVREAVLMDSIRVDWREESQFDDLDAANLHTPTLLLDGERDQYVRNANHGALFPRIGTTDRWWVVLPGVDHVAHLEAQQQFVNVVDAFLRR